MNELNLLLCKYQCGRSLAHNVKTIHTLLSMSIPDEDENNISNIEYELLSYDMYKLIELLISIEECRKRIV